MAKKDKISAEKINEICSIYRKTNSIKETVRLTHHSCTTVCKYLKENGLSKGQGGNQKHIKITDGELCAEVEQNPNAQVIAEKYNMSIESVCKRAAKLGLRVNGSSRKWKYRAKHYGCQEIDETITLDRLRIRDKDICQICGHPVDANDKAKGHVGAQYPSLDHIIPLSKGGNHIWSNVQLAHMGCNSGKCNRI